jgi:hypothetical protein
VVMVLMVHQVLTELMPHNIAAVLMAVLEAPEAMAVMLQVALEEAMVDSFKSL